MSSVAIGMVPKASGDEFLREFEVRFGHSCDLRPAANGKWLAVYGRRRWPSGQRRLMAAYIDGFARRYSSKAMS